jgi:hypothetical protein
MAVAVSSLLDPRGCRCMLPPPSGPGRNRLGTVVLLWVLLSCRTVLGMMCGSMKMPASQGGLWLMQPARSAEQQQPAGQQQQDAHRSAPGQL